MNRYGQILTPPLLPSPGQGYDQETTPRSRTRGPLRSCGRCGEPIRLIAVGESTVAGIGAPTHETALTGHLARELSRHTQRRVQWLVAARSGINAQLSLVELVPKLAGHRADIVLLALGVNDAIEFRTTRRWAADIEKLIEAIRSEVGDALVLLAGVPPLDCFPALPAPLNFVLGARSAALGQASIKLAGRMKRVVHVPFAIAREGRTELFCADGFHPSEQVTNFGLSN